MFIRYQSVTEQRISAWQQAQIIRPLDVALLRALPASAALPEPLLLLLMLASAQLAQGHVCLDLTLSQPRQLLPALLRQSEAASLLTQYFSQYPLSALSAELPVHPATAELLVVLDDSCEMALADTAACPFVLWRQRLYLWRYAKAEAAISQFVHQRASLAAAAKLPAAAQVLRRLFSLNGENSVQGPDAVDWQLQACALAYLRPFAVITGGPGTGKTTTVIKLLILLLSQQADLQIVLAAPTGKAAARLTESISQSAGRLAAQWPTAVSQVQQLKAQTVHRLLQPKSDGSGFRFGTGRVLPADVVIVDEASMLDISLFAALLQALSPQCRLILLGDKDQLASVEAGAVLAELCAHASAGRYSGQTMDQLAVLTNQPLPLAYYSATPDPLDQQVVMLRTSHRFSSDSGIGALARAVNSGDASQSLALLHNVHTDLQLLALPTAADIVSFVVLQLDSYLEQAAALQSGQDGAAATLAACKLHQQLSHFQLLTALRQGPDGSEALNQLIEQRIRRQLQYDALDSWYPGRAIIILQNDYSSGLMNGDIGIALPAAGAMRVAFIQTDGSIRLLLPGRLPAHEPAYVLTVHKSQGSEYRHTALYLPSQWSPVLSRELIYTAITRARVQFSLICPVPGVLQQAILNKTERLGGLRLV